ncbi:hypothetical protein JMUB6875_29340 [Nocardia sp. JMUB6875]|uniref:FUSC family protein n=1 Tax=Nocardia sp. JMUB6875 TaxID=3158170 RepID=UPI0032E661EF
MTADRATPERMAALLDRADHSVRSMWAIYLSREAPARYDRRLALGSALAIGLPIIGGVGTGHAGAGVQAAVAAWFTTLTVPKPDFPSRFRQMLTQSAMLVAATGLGMLVGGRVWATALAAIALSLIVPLPGVAVTPLIAMILGTAPQPGIAAVQHLSRFLGGALLASAVLLIPFFGGSYAPRSGGEHAASCHDRLRPTWAGLRTVVSEGDPRVRYGLRVAVCFTTAYIASALVHMPHAQWMLIGILTTLRSTWDDTRGRIVKRLIGLVAGCTLTAALLAFTSGAPFAAAIAIAVCGGIARPMRGFNYGFWPIFATPVLLLLSDFDVRLGWVDVIERLTDNMLGALLAALSLLLLWPGREADHGPRNSPTAHGPQLLPTRYPRGNAR